MKLAEAGEEFWTIKRIADRIRQGLGIGRKKQRMPTADT